MKDDLHFQDLDVTPTASLFRSKIKTKLNPINHLALSQGVLGLSSEL
jgi:hypothetical protein